jgi:hypothetical protein
MKLPSISMSALAGFDVISIAVVSTCADAMTEERRDALKLGDIYLKVAVNVGCDLSTFRDRDVFTMHEEKQGCCGEENNGRANHRAGHGPGMSASLYFLHGPQGNFLAIHQPDRIDIHVQFASASHPPL